MQINVHGPGRQNNNLNTRRQFSEYTTNSNFPETTNRNPNNNHDLTISDGEDNNTISEISRENTDDRGSESKNSEIVYPKFFNRMFVAVQIFFIIRSVITIAAINVMTLTWAKGALVAYLSIINGIFLAMTIVALVMYLLSGKRDLLYNYVFLFVDSFFLILVLFGMNYYSETEFWSIVFHRSSERSHEVVMFYVKHILLYFPIFLIQFGASFMHTVAVTEIKII